MNCCHARKLSAQRLPMGGETAPWVVEPEALAPVVKRARFLAD